MDHLKKQAAFETSKRLIAQIVNEGLLTASVLRVNGHGARWLELRRPEHAVEKTDIGSVRIALCPDAILRTTPSGDVVSLLRPDSLQSPIMVERSGEISPTQHDPGTLFALCSDWFERKIDRGFLDETMVELRSSAANQVWWLEYGNTQNPHLNSPSIEWEKTLLWGHPTHPWHRTCFAQPPLNPITPDDMALMVDPSIVFLSVPRSALRITGPFERTLQPLLDTLQVPQSGEDRLIVPCLQQQMPSITMRFPDAVGWMTVRCAQAQASMRTLTLSPELKFPYHLKLAVACRITSALRTITPWSACGGLSVSHLLERVLPPNLWIFGEVAAVCGGQEDFNEAKHLACILRDDLEARASASDERLIVAAALAQPSIDDRRCYAERLFGLDSASKKKDWFKRYVACFFQLTLPPLANHGVCLEGHGQNMVARFCRKTGTLKGFAVRDFGGLRLHMPTLHAHGYNLDAVPSGSATKTDDLGEVWRKAHHALVQMHLGHLIGALQLDANGGWAIAREEMYSVLMSRDVNNGQDLYEFFTQDSMPFKCFIKMKLEGKYRDYVERDLPNVLLG